MCVLFQTQIIFTQTCRANINNTVVIFMLSSIMPFTTGILLPNQTTRNSAALFFKI